MSPPGAPLPSASEPLSPAIARFRADVAALAGDAPLALAVSGGADSMAMLVLGAAAFPGRCVAATVDHGLRAGAAAEAAMVARHCATLGIAHTILTLDMTSIANVQAKAREARYVALAAWAERAGANHLATAHHADDQAETFLMRAARASGMAGLAGIRPSRALGPVTLIRPLLGWTRAELRAVIAATGTPFADDPSNADDRFDRTHARRLLAETPWLGAGALARSAAFAADADRALAEITDWLWRSRRLESAAGVLRFDIADVPRELRRRLARVAIDEVRRLAGLGPPTADGVNVEALLDSLEGGKAATQAGVMVSARGECWCFETAPPRRSL
jgi:tRNA(Ile)-lysidine synthase